VSNVEDLYGWQVAIEYDVRVVNCTAVWLPEDNVFKGKNPIFVDPEFKNFTTYGFLDYGATLLSGSVNVPDVGILCSMNFTVLDVGQTALRIATKDNPAVPPGASKMPGGEWTPYEFHTFLFNPNMVELPFAEESGSVSTIGEKISPVAIFTFSPTVLEHGNVLLIGNTTYFVGEPILFNASRSYDPDGSVTKYVWGFGDGNTTEVSVPIIYHAYNKSYLTVNVNLQVIDDDGLSSSTVSQSISVGLTLTPLDYTPILATIFGLIALWIAISVVRAVFRKRRKQTSGI
jgi:hypothetical protein